jgi:hypothetical protein
MKKLLLLSVLFLFSCSEPDKLEVPTTPTPELTCNYNAHSQERTVVYNGRAEIVWQDDWKDTGTNYTVRDCSKLGLIYDESDIYLSNSERVFRRKIVLED